MSGSPSDCDGPGPSQAVVEREGEGGSDALGGVMLGDNFQQKIYIGLILGGIFC